MWDPKEARSRATMLRAVASALRALRADSLFCIGSSTFLGRIARKKMLVIIRVFGSRPVENKMWSLGWNWSHGRCAQGDMVSTPWNPSSLQNGDAAWAPGFCRGRGCLGPRRCFTWLERDTKHSRFIHPLLWCKGVSPWTYGGLNVLGKPFWYHRSGRFPQPWTQENTNWCWEFGPLAVSDEGYLLRRVTWALATEILLKAGMQGFCHQVLGGWMFLTFLKPSPGQARKAEALTKATRFGSNWNARMCASKISELTPKVVVAFAKLIANSWLTLCLTHLYLMLTWQRGCSLCRYIANPPKHLTHLVHWCLLCFICQPLFWRDTTHASIHTLSFQTTWFRVTGRFPTNSCS